MIKVVRKDGIEYEKKERELIYDKKVTIKLNSNQIEKAKEKCKVLNISFAEMIRQGIDYMLEK